MSNRTIDVRELPERFAEIVALVAAGDEVVLTENAVPCARLAALIPSHERRAGLHPGAIEAASGFDDPLPEEFWNGSR